MARAEQADGEPRDIEISHTFDAPRDLVFRNWIEPEHVAAWFAAEGFTVTASSMDARPGGRWRVDFRSETGFVYWEHGTFREIAPPDRLVFTLIQEDAGNVGPETEVTVTFIERDGRTEIAFRQSGFDSQARRDGNAEGWLGCLAKLDAHIAAQRGDQP